MGTLEQRVRRYLLSRLCHRAVLDLYQEAVAAGLLGTHFDRAGRATALRSWFVSDKARDLLSGDPAHDRRIIGRMIGSGCRHCNDMVTDYRFSTDDTGSDCRNIYDWSTPEPADPQRKPKSGRRGTSRESGISFSYVGNLLREHLPAPAPMHVAVALLVARTVGTSLLRLSMLTNPLRSPTPFVLIKAPVNRFEASVGMMLEDGLLLPFPCKLEDVLREGPLSGRYRDSGSAGPQQRRLKTVAGSAALKRDDRIVRGRLRHAMTDEPAPVLVVDETRRALTPVLTETADLVVECTGFDGPMVADLLHICVGVPPQETMTLLESSAFDLKCLSIDDLVLAVRPGRSANEILSILAMLVERCSDEDIDGKAANGENGHRRSSGDRGRGRASEKQTSDPNPGDAGVELILPVAVSDAEDAGMSSGRKQASASRTPVLSVETLSGYGPAREWAIDLKADLGLWREGRLSWSDMSTKLLLSGPPGTGKTTFARALCNSLQVPMLTTSVANWLEPGYLGDVLKLMLASFEAAASRSPSILFIDEIDNIGTRQMAGHRNYDDYWSSLINRLLELLDGSAKTEGVVIVAATNLPEKIDPALLRSGRLESHVRLPLPDLETLTSILAHHLGDDLPEVLSSAPTGRPRSRLRPPPARDNDPQRLRKNAQRRKAEKGKRVSP
ncbi:ATP-binding protein [Rhizobium sp. NTR19]|uniref:ATP-binding protein n=1 Tax=Neorhizobium turbinariae TaxID=2937795 RepID=A0ABT0IVJ6_9HYPH|nr:ATP-binding protein [Neorhizobium turbinariae]MCK8781893.1 ATP-binding protein [Neorhizobium turbinariae]